MKKIILNLVILASVTLVSCNNTNTQQNAETTTPTTEQSAVTEGSQAETFAKKPFLRQPKPQHRFSAVFVSNIH